MIIKSGNAVLAFNDKGGLTSFSDREYDGFNPFKICVQGEGEGQFSEFTSANGYLSQTFDYLGAEEIDGYTSLCYQSPSLGLEVRVFVQPIADTGVFRIYSSLKNIGEKSVEINRFSSVFLTGFGGGITKKAPDITVHYFESCWQAEARYVKKSVKELGLTLASTHAMAKAFTILSQGAYTTGKYMPSMLVEGDGGIRFVFAECDGGWRIQLGHAASSIEHNAGWFIESDAISASDIGSALLVGAGESFTTPTVLAGFAEGGIDEAMEAITLARRVVYNGAVAPLMFNDYMNCIWCNVNEKITEKLAKKAASVGVEGYCIDSGWYKMEGGETFGVLGDWAPDDDRFGEGGVKGTVETIRSLGLVPGLWTELEVCSEGAAAYSFPDEYFILSNGKRVGDQTRVFFDFRNPAVCDYIEKCVRRIYDMGVRYIKNDFNAALRWITDAEAIRENQRAVIAFYARIRALFPDLYIENCGSGGLRSEYGMLKNFCVQSTSDQEIYYLYPPIVQGMLANILPEHAGVWAYPYPHLFDVRNDPTALDAEAERQADGRQTVFNMVSGIAGNLYLSGRIDRADEFNTMLISEGISLFKSLREFKANATPVYPNGFSDISDLGEFTTLGMISRDKKKLVLYFWRFEAESNEFKVPVGKWMKGDASVKRIYPAESSVSARVEGESVVISAGEDFSAAIFEVDFN